MRQAFSQKDHYFMQIALQLAEKAKGFTEPNPMVGAVVVKNEQIISAGYHRCCGLDHAERMALKNTQATGATLYVNLEPCDHLGRTPACTEIIKEKKVKRVVIAHYDPNPLVNGKGIKRLKKAGIRIETGLLKKEAQHLNRHYLTFMTKKRPYIALHAGVSLDGKMSDRTLSSCWINSALSRQFSHSLRTEFSAILAGVNTVINDNPYLTIRQPGFEKKVFSRIILDTDNRLSKKLNIFQNQDRFPLIIFSSEKAENKEKQSEWHFFIQEDKDGLDLAEVLDKIRQLNICSILVEGGARVLNSFLKKGLFDELILFYSNRVLGGINSLTPFSEGWLLNEAKMTNQFSLTQLESDFIWRGWF